MSFDLKNYLRKNVLLENTASKDLSYYKKKLDRLEAQLRAAMEQFKGANGKINNKEKYKDAVGKLPSVIKQLKAKVAKLQNNV